MANITRAQRAEVTDFVMALAHVYPSATVAQALELMLSARRLKAHPEDVAEIQSTVAKYWPFRIRVDGNTLWVNMNPRALPHWREVVRV